MKVLVVSGIWPPDVGGPATHAPELASWLRAHGHDIEVVTTASHAPAREDYPVRWVSRRLPAGVRHVAVSLLVARRARAADVVYATSMVGRSAAGTLLARRPLIAKVTSDAAFERGRRRGGERLLGVIRDWSVRRAAAVICPSSFIAERATAWRGTSDGVVVLPNPAPDPAEAAQVDLPVRRPALGFAGRLTEAKDLDVALDALEQLDASLVIVGDGEERARLEASARRFGDRVAFVGARSRAEVLGYLAASDVAVLPSAWENFPHMAVEALAMGTPVVASRVGGVPEIVRDGESGILVEPGDVDAFAAAVRQVLADRERYARAAAPSVERFSLDTVYGEIERLLQENAR